VCAGGADAALLRGRATSPLASQPRRSRLDVRHQRSHRGTGSRLDGRVAPAFGNDYILGGKAFRHLAAQSNLPVTKLVRSMREREWNFEP